MPFYISFALIAVITLLTGYITYISLSPSHSSAGESRWPRKRIIIVAVSVISCVLLILKGYLDLKDQEHRKIAEQNFKDEILRLNNRIADGQLEILKKLESVGLGYDTIRDELVVINKEVASRFIALSTAATNPAMLMDTSSSNLSVMDSIETATPTEIQRIPLQAGECEQYINDNHINVSGKIRVINKTGIPLEVTSISGYSNYNFVNVFVAAGHESKTPLLATGHRDGEGNYSKLISDYTLYISSVTEDGDKPKSGVIHTSVKACEETVLILTNNNLLLR